jgi:hypothetical protein
VKRRQNAGACGAAWDIRLAEFACLGRSLGIIAAILGSLNRFIDGSHLATSVIHGARHLEDMRAHAALEGNDEAKKQG